MSYIKAHPFGYKQQAGSSKYYGHQIVRKQVITRLVPFTVTRRDEAGNVIMVPELNKRGKPTSKLIPATQTFYNKVTKVINHYINPVKRGRTLGEMVYSTYQTQ